MLAMPTHSAASNRHFFPARALLREMLPRKRCKRLTRTPVRNILNIVQFVVVDRDCVEAPPVLMLNRPHIARAPAGATEGGDGASGAPGISLPESRPEVLDPHALARLRELDPSGEGKLLERVLKAFESSVARLRPQLEGARAAGDLPTVRHVAHTLKSSSASIGASQLSQLCTDIEIMVRESRTAGLDRALDAMMIQLDLLPEVLNKSLNSWS